jgi:hypothetical protein
MRAVPVMRGKVNAGVLGETARQSDEKMRAWPLP